MRRRGKGCWLRSGRSVGPAKERRPERSGKSDVGGVASASATFLGVAPRSTLPRPLPAGSRLRTHIGSRRRLRLRRLSCVVLCSRRNPAAADGAPVTPLHGINARVNVMEQTDNPRWPVLSARPSMCHHSRRRISCPTTHRHDASHGYMNTYLKNALSHGTCLYPSAENSSLTVLLKTIYYANKKK